LKEVDNEDDAIVVFEKAKNMYIKVKEGEQREFMKKEIEEKKEERKKKEWTAEQISTLNKGIIKYPPSYKC
jgi:hypothetical protein